MAKRCMPGSSRGTASLIGGGGSQTGPHRLGYLGGHIAPFCGWIEAVEFDSDGSSCELLCTRDGGQRFAPHRFGIPEFAAGASWISLYVDEPPVLANEYIRIAHFPGAVAL